MIPPLPLSTKFVVHKMGLLTDFDMDIHKIFIYFFTQLCYLLFYELVYPENFLFRVYELEVL